MKAFILISGLLLAGLLGYGYYLHRTLQPLMSAKGADAELQVYKPPPVEEATTSIDLGYARFDLPASLAGNPAVIENALFIALGKESASRELVVGPPICDDDPQMVAMLAEVEELIGERVRNTFELKKRSYATRPFSAWNIPFMGRRRAVTEAGLMFIKVLDLGEFGVRVSENEKVGLLWIKRDRLDTIAVFDKQKRVTQTFLIDPHTKGIEQLVAVLLNSYHFTSDATDEETWREEAREAGFQFQFEKPETVGSMPSEEERLSMIAEEVRARRAERKARQ